MAGYTTEAIFDINDKATPKLTALITKLEATQAALDKASIAMMELGANTEFTAVNLGKLNLELSQSNRTLTGVVGKSEKAALGFDAMANASKKAYGSFVQTNIQMQEFILTATEAKLAMAGLNVTMARGGTTRVGKVGTVSAGGMAASAAHGGDSFIGGIGKVATTAMIGMIGFDMAKAGMKPAEEYQGVVGGLRSMGLSDAQVNKAQRQAAQMHRDMPMTTETGNLENMKELQGVFRDFDKVLETAQDFAKTEVAIQSLSAKIPSLKGHEKGMALTIAKEADMAGLLNPNYFTQEKWHDFLDQNLKSLEASGGTVSPRSTAQMYKFARSARTGKSDDFMLGTMGYFLEEGILGKQGGGSATVGPMLKQLDKSFLGGHVDKRLGNTLSQLGLIEGQKAGTDIDKFSLHTQTMTTGMTSQIKGMPLFIKDPFKWSAMFQDAMLKKVWPALTDKQRDAKFYGMKPEEQKALITPYTQGLTGLSRDIFEQFIMNRKQIEASNKARDQALGVEAQYAKALELTSMKALSLASNMEVVTKNIGMALTPAINQMLDSLNGVASAFFKASMSMPETNKAMEDFNKTLFGAKGSFSEMGAELTKISENSGPLIQLLDKIGAMTLHAANIGGNSMVKGAVRGAQRAQEFEKKTGIPAWFTAPEEMMNGAIAQPVLDMSEAGAGKLRGIGRRLGEFPKKKLNEMDPTGHAVGLLENAGNIAREAPGVAQGMAKEGMQQLVINFNGGVFDPTKIVDMVKGAVMSMLARNAHGHNATSSFPSSNFTNKTN